MLAGALAAEYVTGGAVTPLVAGIFAHVSMALLVGGIILIIYGMSASDSIGSGFSRFFTGSPTDKTMWLLIGGIAAAAAGLVGVLRGSKS